MFKIVFYLFMNVRLIKKMNMCLLIEFDRPTLSKSSSQS